MYMYNTELNDLRIIVCLRKSEVSVEKISVCRVTENLTKHGIYCLPCQKQPHHKCYRNKYDVIFMSR